MTDGPPIPDQKLRDLALRIADVLLLPSTLGRLSDLYPTRTERARFAHYTSAEAAIKIIQQKRLWMRNATCMVDYAEVQHGHEYLVNALSKDSPIGKEFMSALDACAPGVAREAMDRFNLHWVDIYLSTYITSTSEHPAHEDMNGRLSMWRAAGTDAPRVALVVSVPWFAGAAYSLGIFFQPVVYLDGTDLNSELMAVISKVQANVPFLKGVDRQLLMGFVYQLFLSACVCLKHKGFSEEREWRAVYGPNRLRSPLMEESTECVDRVPQTVHRIPLDVKKSPDLAAIELSTFLDRLIVGPTAYPAVLREVFVRELKAAGVPDPEKKVVSSDIPLRS